MTAFLGKKNILFVMALVLLLSSIGSVSATAVSPSPEMDKEYQDLVEVFSAIEALPDSVIAEGDQAVVDWLKENSNIPVQQKGEFVTLGVVGCVSAVGLAIVSNLIPIAKVAKIKSAIKAAGGATKFVKALIPAYKAARRMGKSKYNSVKVAVSKAAKKASPEAKRALIDLFNLGSIYSSCFE
ncbi:hypothetical protein P9E05_19970 [Bacillus mojavensis]|uniref:hypothetical protein n=1 Tax=Bacillus mojavensis TaxID=72360 RepID=UPI002DB587BF|nr:hypothetical protein [Bacillus mojavensis]MEC1693693.1 hypothetical protein [Bacillus mojavensis]